MDDEEVSSDGWVVDDDEELAAHPYGEDRAILVCPGVERSFGVSGKEREAEEWTWGD